jgi:flagellar biosynthesis/type III secretory pathway protein FliH
MHKKTGIVMDEVRHLRWRLSQMERDFDDYRALWEEECAEHRLTKERMAQATDEAYSKGYQAGRVEGFEAGLQAGRERMLAQLQGMEQRVARARNLLESILCTVVEGQELMRSSDIYRHVEWDASEGMKVLDGDR